MCPPSIECSHVQVAVAHKRLAPLVAESGSRKRVGDNGGAGRLNAWKELALHEDCIEAAPEFQQNGIDS